MSDSLPASGGRPEVRRVGFKAMPGSGQFSVGVLWFFCGAMVLCTVIALALTVPDFVSAGWSTLAARGFGLSAVFAALALVHGGLAVGVVRRWSLARRSAVVFEFLVIAGCLYLAVHAVTEDFWGSLEDLGGLLFGVLVAAVVAANFSSSEMRTWCDR